jgi:DNA-binding MarR family transcriptional regulator
MAQPPWVKLDAPRDCKIIRFGLPDLAGCKERTFVDQFKAKKIKDALKDLLKTRGLTYQDLATDLECSLPTVKRILGPEELTLTRLLQLCEILEIDLADLEALTTEANDREEKFSPTQDQFLAKNPHMFAYLMKLFGGESPKKIAEQHGLTPRSTDKYLIALEKQGLIRVSARQKVKPAFRRIPTLGRGPLAKAFFESMIRAAAQFFINSIHAGFANPEPPADRADGKKFGILSLQLSKASYRQWADEQEKSLRHLEKLSNYEEKALAPEQLMTLVVLSAHAMVPTDDPELKTINNSMGHIIPLP